jgi:hypothetical protein
MLTKAYISEVISPYSVKIRMPLYNKISGVNGATPKNELPMACVCTLPNYAVSPVVGDIVIVGFEEDDISKPVILGFLSRYKESESSVNISCEDFKATGDINLSSQTSIGDVKSDNIKCLLNLKSNIKDTFEELKLDVSAVSDRLDASIQSAGQVGISVESQALQIESLNNQVMSLNSRLSTLEATCETLADRFNEYLMKYPTILGNNSYGDTLPKEATEGQIFLSIKEN